MFLEKERERERETNIISPFLRFYVKIFLVEKNNVRFAGWKEKKKKRKRSSTTRRATIKLVRGGFVMTIVACKVERTREREKKKK